MDTREYAPYSPDLPTPTVRAGQDSDTASTSSRIRLGKRALAHPPAVSEISLGGYSANSSGDEAANEKAVDSYPKGWKLACITLALCCAVFVTTLVCACSYVKTVAT